MKSLMLLLCLTRALLNRSLQPALPLLCEHWLWLIAACFLLILCRACHRRLLQWLAQITLRRIDRMSGREFEEYLEALFTKLGYDVERTRCVGDFGADLIVRKGRTKQVIQAKRYRGKVGPKAIGDVLRAKGNYACTEAMVVTNSFFTRQAIQEARANQVTLCDRERLRQLLTQNRI